MAGIYVHIPFCKKACHYCNFHFSVSLKNKNGFIAALLKEIALQENYLQQETIHTIYFGGGTPSLLDETDLQQIFQQLYRHFTIAPQAEVTLEANPDDVTAEKLHAWQTAGINRLSIGIQSFFEKDLAWMNRAHNASQALTCITLAQQAGLSNLSIDLIYGTPGLTDDEWHRNVSTALELSVPHLSCYALTVEPGTALQKMIAQHKKKAVVTDQQATQFGLVMDWLQQAGYEHYEISNFARPGHRSRHNAAYWSGAKYLGLGPSAHSFNGTSRQWNVANNALYIQSLSQGIVPFEAEQLTATQHLNEYIMTSLRTMEGLDLKRIDQQFGETARRQLEKSSRAFVQTGKLVLNDAAMQLTKEGKLFADGIAAELFFLPADGVGANGFSGDANNRYPEQLPVKAP